MCLSATLYIALALAAVATPVQAQATARFGLVLGNNAPQDNRRTPLSYADDDALMTHRLLTEAHVDSTLLVLLDHPTVEQWPETQSRTPSQRHLAASVAELSSKIRRSAD